MARVLKRPQAQADLIEIWDYIAQDSEGSADAFLDTLDERFDLLAAQPQLGRERPELGEGIRSFPIGRYLVYYRALMASRLSVFSTQHATSFAYFGRSESLWLEMFAAIVPGQTELSVVLGGWKRLYEENILEHE